MSPNGRIYCADCNETHDLLSLDSVFFRYPDAQLEVPFAEQATRIRYFRDFSVIDGVRYLLRGWLQIPIIGWDRPYFWGGWAEVTETTYQRCFELRLSEDQASEPLFQGVLDTSLPGYTMPTRGLPVEIRLHQPGTLPEFIVVDDGMNVTASEGEDSVSKRTERLGYQQRYGVLPRDMVRWLHGCM